MKPFESTLEQLKSHFDSGLTRPLSWRLNQLEQLHRFLTENETSLLDALESDLNKHPSEARLTELQFLQNDIKHTLRALPKWNKARKVSNPLLAWPAKSQLIPEPLGTVLILGAWNYPLQLLLAPLVAAIAAGNCALIKPSEHATATAEILSRQLPDYLDNAAIKIVTGSVTESKQLTALPFDHIFYTGGENAAKAIMAAAAENLTPVTLELGGKSPAVVLADAPIQVTARRIIWGKFLNAGQTCIAPDYVLVEDSVREQLINAMQQELLNFYGEDPQQSSSYSRIIHHDHWQRLTQMLQQENVVIGGDSDSRELYIAPTIVDGVKDGSQLMKEEIFGPILPVLTIKSAADAIEKIHMHPKPLALYVFSNNQRLLDLFTQKVSAGNVCYNDTLMFMLNDELPFGGVGHSGMGRYHGKWGFDTLSHLKPVMKRSFRFDVALRYPPYSKLKDKILSWISP
ncbi:aldehyde dehydrogenase family protein [Idiomarina sp. HP20-50]|uniref:aldehyde dehydrogenase family protein n=1 Tax=Idiomarina sp. HP20-50 TaxID=3070813 RepID=UPI00294B46EA|nr:aldehyde dehydrogenase family protein [Idiomarina sp. HP20-50]MDV6315799.1 aldehyde dehydrogenase family protein [Idiomarina sp. HP20-50]